MPAIDIYLNGPNPKLPCDRILKNLNVMVSNKLKTRVGEAANFAVNYMRSRAHVVTGHMKKNIQQQVVGPANINVVSKARYAGYENKRGSFHAYFDMGYKATYQKYPDLVFSDIISVLRSPQIVI